MLYVTFKGLALRAKRFFEMSYFIDLLHFTLNNTGQ